MSAPEPVPSSQGERIRQLLAEGVERLRRAGGGGSEGPIRRVEVPVTGFDALAWLCAQPRGSRGYWSDREGCFELAGVGRADTLTGDSAADYQRLLATLGDRVAAAGGRVRYLGGLRFSGEGPGEGPWARFRAYRFVLPRFEVARRNGLEGGEERTTFSCNLRVDEDPVALERELAALVFAEGDCPHDLPAPGARREAPDRAGWIRNVEAVLAALRPGVYDKAVLARRVTFEFDRPLDAAALLRRLKAATGPRYHFCFQPDAEHAFVGGSPERLYRRDRRQLATEAVAGTRGRGATPAEDKRLREELLTDDKERREQGHVVAAIARALADLSERVDADARPSVLELTRAQHLITRFRATLRRGVNDAELLARLHPTPAVGGHPTARALADIARLEPFDRGWYAGAVGWVARDAAQFAVGIRSALVDGSRLHVFSGAGIVEGSRPEAEWDEVEGKIGDFVAALERR